MEQAMSFNNKSIIRLNVGGSIFQCHARTLKTFPDSVLARLDEGTDYYMTDNAEYFFDRNPLTFAYILDASRKVSIHLPKDMCGTTFREELEFWKISPRHFAPCCWEALYKSEEDMSTMQKLIKNLQQNTNMCLLFKPDVKFRQKIWLSQIALVWGAFISLLIVLSTLSVALSTLPQFMEMNLSKLDSVHTITAYIVFKHIVIFKLARLLYLTKRIPAFNIIGLTFRSSGHELQILVFMLGILICIFGSIMFIAEYVQNTDITNMSKAMYWALITLTTVGYGHYIPDTVFGHVVAGACAVCGVVCLALPIGIIASSLHTFYNYHKYAQKHVDLYGKGTLCPYSDQKQK